jgi:putative ATP-binding cassette transporter
MNLIIERLPQATIVSVGHRAELDAFHTRKLVLEYHPEGSLIRDESLAWTFRRSARFLARLLNREAAAPAR